MRSAPAFPPVRFGNTPACDSSPHHGPSVGRLQIGDRGQHIDVCKACLRSAIETFLNDQGDGVATTFTVTPAVAA